METINEHEVEARIAKATQLVMTFHRLGTTASTLRQLGEQGWEQAAKVAGLKHPPSDKTKAIVLQILAALDEARAKGIVLDDVAVIRADAEKDIVDGWPEVGNIVTLLSNGRTAYFVGVWTHDGDTWPDCGGGCGVDPHYKLDEDESWWGTVVDGVVHGNVELDALRAEYDDEWATAQYEAQVQAQAARS